ncbi:tRNA (adenosine(37)-N6)-threonylcarbamoyltransferase complex transferase subunit TsaD [Patescibacteria group bacterium]
MIILAIETSCDETAIAIVKFQKSKPKVLSNIISSQVKIHREWGGVVPKLAKREHQKNLVSVLKKSLKEAKILQKAQKIDEKRLNVVRNILKREQELYGILEKFLKTYQKPDIDFITVTSGPGLEPALWVGVNFAKALSYFWNLPLVPVSHIEAHVFSNFINKKSKKSFPVLSLSVSGGHNQLILMNDFGNYQLIGETRDDTAGECFDKVARMLGLGYPGGPEISKLAKKGNPDFFRFPRPMMHKNNYDFSFSGLKTAVLYYLKNQDKNTIKKHKNDIAASFQQAVIDVLINKTIRAAKQFQVKTIAIEGGVAANRELQGQLKKKIKKDLPKINFLIPNLKFCTDNAVMVAMVGHFYWKKKRIVSWKKIRADANLKI